MILSIEKLRVAARQSISYLWTVEELETRMNQLSHGCLVVLPIDYCLADLELVDIHHDSTTTIRNPK